MSINTRTGRTDTAVRSGIAARLAEIKTRAGKALLAEAETSLRLDGFNLDEDYPEYGQGQLMNAYLLGSEDARADVPALTNGLESVLDYVARCEESGITMQPGDVRRLVAAALGVTA